jgi:4-aminobutyrate aminotransferase-like enzyme
MADVAKVLKDDEKYIMHGWGKIAINVKYAKGAVFYDETGKEYIDMLSQTAGVMGIGHSHPKIVQVVKDQVEKSTHVLTCFINEPRIEFGKKLAQVAPGKLKDNCKFYFSSGGSEANETALKLAMKSTGKPEVISTYYSYHGGTLALMGLLGQSYIVKGPWPKFPGFTQIPNAYCYRCVYGQQYPGCNFECARHLETHIQYGTQGDVAAFIQEPVPGNGGHQVPPSKEYFKIIREICDKYGILYISDEVQTGNGRSGKWWAADYFDFTPDIFTTAKAIGGGMAVGATGMSTKVVPADVADENQWHIFTYGGSPIACAAGAAAVDIINEEDLPGQAARQGKRIDERLREFQKDSKIVGDVRSMGLFIGVELVKDKKTKEKFIDGAGDVQTKCLDDGVFYGVSNMSGFGNVIKLKPPLSITDEQTDRALDSLEAAIREVEKKL